MDFEGGFWDDPDDFIEDEVDEVFDIADEIFDVEHEYTEIETEDFFIKDILDMDDMDVAFMLGFGDTMADEGPPRKADRHRNELGTPVPLVDTRRLKKGLAEEFLEEFERRHSK